MQNPRLTVIGTGYLGATHAVCMAALGFEVLGVEIDERKVARLASGEVPFFEPGLPELLVKALESGRLRFTTSYEEAAEFGDVHFICVGTPQKEGSDAADMTYVDAGQDQVGTCERWAREDITRYFQVRYGLRVDPSNIQVTHRLLP